jgi:hypothetical protein
MLPLLKNPALPRPRERLLVTPCCRACPVLDDYRLHCTLCGRVYDLLAELVVEKGDAA